MNTESKYLTYLSASKNLSADSTFFCNAISQNKAYLLCKRAFDLLVSIFFIVFILSWFLPIIAIFIKIETEGPVFFVQKRVGKGGRLFSCYKLRTMIVNDYADNTPAAENDWRITRIGKFLRKSNIDEFPQFFNILFGNMSLIGPRPHMIADCDRFSSIFPAYNFRNFVRPGITGLAQVKGFHGPATDFGSVLSRYQYDTFYVNNVNFQLDFEIIRTTVKEYIKSIQLILKELVFIKKKFQEI
jgi:putative colanic acid biosysnthesis UDP-glucose lipid carrier transferase